MSPFLMLYGKEALMPEEIPHVTYVSNDSYEVAVEKHINKMLAIYQEAIKKNRVSVQRSKENFDRKFVKKTQPHDFVVGDIVLMNIKKRIKDIKNVKVQWIGPCTVVYKRPGHFYDIEYKCEGSTV